MQVFSVLFHSLLLWSFLFVLLCYYFVVIYTYHYSYHSDYYTTFIIFYIFLVTFIVIIIIIIITIIIYYYYYYYLMYSALKASQLRQARSLGGSSTLAVTQPDGIYYLTGHVLKGVH